VELYDLYSSPNIVYSGDKMKKNEIDGGCGIFDGEQK